MLFGKKPERLMLVLGLCGSCLPLLGPCQSHAADITLGIIGPHEYDLPVDYKPFNVLVQYGDGNAAGNSYNSTGQREAAHGGGHTWSGLTKYVHFRTFDALPHVGFAFEVIQSESYTLAGGTNYGGLGGTIVGPAAWFKPNAHSTLGFQTFMQTPSGTRNSLASGYWANISSIIFDYEWKHFSFDGDLGTVTGSTKHKTNEHSYSPGVVFYSNLRFSWKATKLVEPFFAFDWQNVGGTYDQSAHYDLNNSNSREIAPGLGVMFNISRTVSFTARYAHSIEGRNVPETNAYYVKFLYLWP